MRALASFVAFISLVSIASATLESPFAKRLRIGDFAPKIRGINQYNKEVDFSEEYHTHDWVLVFFFPSRHAPTTQSQVLGLKEKIQRIQARKVAIVGVGTESQEEQFKFREQFKLPFDLIADSDKRVSQAFGVPTSTGFATGCYFLIHKGKIAHINRKGAGKELAIELLAFIDNYESSGS